METKITTMDRVLHEIYLKGRELKFAELKSITKLRDHQIYRALYRLNQRGLIKKSYEPSGKLGYKKGLLVIKMRNLDHTRNYLSRKGLE